MPIRGLRDTAPFHWDGIPGDPYGGNNSAKVHGHTPPNSDSGNPESSARHLIDGSLASTMLLDGDTRKNDKGKVGLLSEKERDEMARFLLSVPYPPSQRRAYDNVLSKRAEDGFELFHIKGNHEDKPQPNVCGDCHRMPFLVSTNTPGSGMDAPTWRGAYDRFLILPQGRLNIIDFDFYRRFAEKGIPERDMWRLSWRSKPRFDPVWEMVLEGSTGYSGSYARQLTLNHNTVGQALTHDLLPALESSAKEGAVILQVDALFLKGKKPIPLTLQFQNDRYFQIDGERLNFTREQLLDLAEKGSFTGTLTARHGSQSGFTFHQPALWTLSALHKQRGRQHFPILTQDQKSMSLNARHVTNDAHVIVNGRRVSATIKKEEAESISIKLDSLPPKGINFLQVQNAQGLFSNDFIFHVADNAGDVAKSLQEDPDQLRNRLERVIASGSLLGIRNLLKSGNIINRRHGENGMTPLSSAAFHGKSKVTTLLLEHKADLRETNRDGNTALHIAAFMCQAEIVKTLLKNGASTTARNHRRESPIDTVSGEWSDGLGDFYQVLINSTDLDLDLAEVQKLRPQITTILRKHSAK